MMTNRPQDESFLFPALSRETGKLSDQAGNPAGNPEETISLKALALKVLQGNSAGNFRETPSFPPPGNLPINPTPGKPFPKPVSSDSLTEAIREKAAVLEFDAGLTREAADHRAPAAIGVFRFRLSDDPTKTHTLLDPGADLAGATATLHHQFGAERVLSVTPYNA
ncbi:MAG: hypothetical protein HQL47_05425 [Gammaproteobacteria bacterium]|nr:hypothetical protein [Gammaproteobacteria bacterium]